MGTNRSNPKGVLLLTPGITYDSSQYIIAFLCKQMGDLKYRTFKYG